MYISGRPRMEAQARIEIKAQKTIDIGIEILLHLVKASGIFLVSSPILVE